MVDTAIILAAGMGTRLRPYTYEIPKGFMKIENETLIERSIRILRSNHVKNIFIVCGHLREKYLEISEQYGIQLIDNTDYATTGSFNSLILGNGKLNSGFLVLESDILYEERAISSLMNSDEKNAILVSGFTQSGDEVYVELDQDFNLINLSKDASMLSKKSGELVGIWKLSLDFFKKLCEYFRDNENADKMDYEVAIADLNKNESTVKAVMVDDLVWCEIDDENHLNRAKKNIYPRLP